MIVLNDYSHPSSNCKMENIENFIDHIIVNSSITVIYELRLQFNN